MTAYTGTPALPLGLAGDIPNAATDWAAILGALHGATDAWVTWAPTLTNLTLGNGTVTAKYRQVGKTVDYRFKFKLGNTSAVGTGPKFTLPVAPHSEYISDEDRLGVASLLDAGVNLYDGFVRYNGASTVELSAFNASGASVWALPISATVPFTWGTADSLSASGTYEAA